MRVNAIASPMPGHVSERPHAATRAIPQCAGFPKLVIFDCDGVLIDSEIVVCRLVAEELTRLGYPLTVRDVIARYAGRPQRDMIADIECSWNQAIPPEYFVVIERRIADAYAAELRGMPGAAAMLDTLRVPFCVASSADPKKLELGLRVTGLYDRLAPNLVSASLVHHGKPAPDVFIYAAGWMRTPVADCLVIEDSLAGTRAARAAGMRVLGFTGGAHCDLDHGRALLDAGAEQVMESLAELEAFTS